MGCKARPSDLYNTPWSPAPAASLADADRRRRGPGKDWPRQLLHRQLPALLVLEAAAPAGGRGRAERRPGPRYAARFVPAHPVLPEAVQVLLLPGLHRQECEGHR